MDQLLPLDSPEEAIKSALDGLKSSDWSQQFEACNIIRRACANHAPLLAAGGATIIHAIVIELQRQIESLRSSLIKNGILTLIGKTLSIIKVDLVKTLKKSLDIEIDIIVSTVIRKGLETSSFIGSRVNDLLNAICENCSENRSVSAVLAVIGSRKVQHQKLALL